MEMPPSPIPALDPVLAPSTPPRRGRGRPTLYTPALTNLILTLVRTHGLAPTAAAEHVGIGRGTLSRWRYEYPNLDSRLHHARLEYRTAHGIGRPRSRTTPDGRPNWRTAAWELENAFPEEYSLDPKRRAAYRAARDAETAAFEQERTRWLAEQNRSATSTVPESSEVHPLCASAPLREPPSAASESSESPLCPTKPTTPKVPKSPTSAPAAAPREPCTATPTPHAEVPIFSSSAPSAALRETSPSAPAAPKVPKYPSSVPSAPRLEPPSAIPTSQKLHDSPATALFHPTPLNARFQPPKLNLRPSTNFKSSEIHPAQRQPPSRKY